MIGFCGLRHGLHHLNDAPEGRSSTASRRRTGAGGFAIEAATMFRYGFEVVGLDRVLDIADAQIVASRSVLEKLRMNFEQEGFHEGR